MKITCELVISIVEFKFECKVSARVKTITKLKLVPVPFDLEKKKKT